MTDALASLVPQIVLRQVAADPAQPRKSVEQFPAAVMFADVSGFTALTETLAQRGPLGAEQLTELLNDYFGQLVGLIVSHGGDIVKFAGDALIAVWSDPHRHELLPTLTQRAAECAIVVRDTMRQWRHRDGHRLGLRLTLGAGTVTALTLGGVFDRWECVMAGPPVAQIAAADRLGSPGEIVVSAAVATVLGDAITVEVLSADGVARLVAVGTSAPDISKPVALSTTAVAPANRSRVRAFIPRAVLSHLDRQQTEWLADLRRTSVLFVNLPGMDFADPTALDRAQAATVAVQRGLYEFEGSLNKLLVDDKGTTFVAALGLPPLSHEDDAARAVRAAMAIQRALAEEWQIASSIGVATGRVFCGLVGGSARREYTLIGDVVNLAARLMQAANGSVLCDEATATAAQHTIPFAALPPIALKGKRAEVPVFRPLQEGRVTQRITAPMVGRATERQSLGEAVERAKTGARQVVVIEGDAGIGKSQLVNFLLGSAHAAGIRAVLGAGDSIDRNRPYHAWQPIFRALLLESSSSASASASADEEPVSVAERAMWRETIVQRLPEPHRRLAPLLEAVVPLDWPETEVTRWMSGKARAENTRDVALSALQSVTALTPVVAIVEDAHWLDSASWALLLRAARDWHGALLAITTRPFLEQVPPEFPELLATSGTTTLRLDALSPADSARLVCQRLGARTLPAAVEALIHERAEGHPFFCEELALALRDAGIIRVADGRCELATDHLASLDLPQTVQGAIISRIDRLTPAHQLAVKSAAVIGRVFEYATLYDVFPLDAERPQLPACMQRLEQLEMTTQTASDPARTYAFRHIITQQVAYDLMLYSQRRKLHRAVAEWIEQRFAEDLPPHFQTLAHHWRQAEDVGKARDYAILAGEQALHGGSYAEAIKYFSTAWEMAGDQLRADPFKFACVARKLGDAYMGLGQMPPCESALHQAAHALREPVPVAKLNLLVRLFAQIATQARHAIRPRQLAPTPAPASVTSATTAATAATAGDDTKAARCLEGARIFEGLARTYVWGDKKIHGIHAAIRALNLAERAGQHSPELARAYANIAYAAGISRLHRLARHYVNRALTTARAVDDAQALAWALEVTGVYWLTVGAWGRAREQFAQAIAICTDIGDHRLKGENLEVCASLLYHQDPFVESLRMRDELGKTAQARGDRQQEVWALRGRALSWLRLGNAEKARELLDAATAMLEQSPDRLATVFCSGVSALVQLHLGNADAALFQAERARTILGASTLVHFGTLEAFSAVAETFLQLAQQAQSADPERFRHLLDRGVEATARLLRYASVFRIGQPRAFLWQGLGQWMAGRAARAIRSWHKSRDWAVRLAMPFEEALACAHLAAHLPASHSAERAAFHHRAAAIFAHLDARRELAHLTAPPGG